MKILVLGAGGMLGHKMYQTLSGHFRQVFATVRKPKDHYQKFEVFAEGDLLDSIDVSNEALLVETLNELRPQVIINCIGATTRKLKAIPASTVIKINSLLPHQLAEWCQGHKARLFHFSTDCVFSGKAGNYQEDSLTDAPDLYGKSKALGEVNLPGTVTIRSSIIGRELEGKTELVEWFLSQKGKRIKGYSNVFYTGVTTNYMANLVSQLITDYPNLSGLHQVTSPKISKFELLSKLNQAFKTKTVIEPEDSYVSHKDLNGSRFANITKITPPTWDEMIDELVLDSSNY